jgi:MFS family permease
MINRLRLARQEFPQQFWLLFWGVLISTFGGSMIWPFMMIYVSGKLALPLMTVASLLTLNSVMGLIFSFIAGPVTDRFGRKWVMVISLLANAVTNIFMSQAHTLPAFAILMGLSGAFNPLLRVGADAMMADLVPPEKRPDAYSLLRMSNNVGVALGPAIGGFIAASSYTWAFLIAAAGMLIYGLLMAFLGHETLPSRAAGTRELVKVKPEKFAGYDRIFRDRRFVSFVFGFTLNQICASIMWVMLSVYTKTNFGLSERVYGMIPTTNALMVVFLQIYVTQFTKHRPPLLMLASGAFFYAIGLASVAFGQGFWGFWLSMVIMSIGELIIVPTATTYAANAAPADMRGRYMSLYGLSQGVATGIGPILAGYLNDNISPVSIWYGAGMVGFFAVSIFLILFRRYPHPPAGKPVLASPSTGVEIK